MGTPPTPHPQASVPFPLWFRGKGHTRLRERKWESPNSDDGTYTVVLYTYKCTLRLKTGVYYGNTVVEEENKRLRRHKISVHHVEKICRAKSANVMNVFYVYDVTCLFLLLGNILHLTYTVYYSTVRLKCGLHLRHLHDARVLTSKESHTASILAQIIHF
jgi:hypothetical protein